MKQVNLRLPDDVHAQLVSLAAEDQRSVNKEILWLIERYVDATRARRSNPGIGYPGPAPQGSDSSPA